MTTMAVPMRNVNSALKYFVEEASLGTLEHWRVISPRGLETVEYKGLWVTEYEHPAERVLFSPERDANPFFHLMEALWILAGRDDLGFLASFNANMANFSDDGITFHAPYGHRLRRHFQQIDQIAETIVLLTKEPDTRRAVMAIWDPAVDCNVQSRDIPCNDLIMFKIRDGVLNMTVSCRSNDAIWGAYGANAVQFSMLQEFVASACGVGVGKYVQISDSMHVYTSNPAWRRLLGAKEQYDPYITGAAAPYPLLAPHDDWRRWLDQCELFVADDLSAYGRATFFTDVAMPVRSAWHAYKDGRAAAALNILKHDCRATDWRVACMEWIHRRA